MVDRQEVEDLLADATHPHSYMERVPADTLFALCRAWLAVDAGVPGVVDSILYADGERDVTTIQHVHSGTGPIFQGSGYVRIVREPDE